MEKPIQESKKKTGILDVIPVQYLLFFFFIFAVIAILASIILSVLDVWPYDKSGTIGDTIGGVAGPVLNFAGLILIYLSFKEQFRANVGLRDELENQEKHMQYERNYNLITNKIDKYKLYIKQVDFPGIKANLEEIFNHEMGDYYQAYGDIRYNSKTVESLHIEHKWRFNENMTGNMEGRTLYIAMFLGNQIIENLNTLSLYDPEKEFLQNEILFSLYDHYHSLLELRSMLTNSYNNFSFLPGQYVESVIVPSPFMSLFKK